MTVATCTGDALCPHFKAETFDGVHSEIQHADDPDIYTGVAGVYSDGLCDEGHDLALERWAFALMEANGCAPA